VGFFDWLSPPRPAPVIIIRNVLGEEIDRVFARDLYNQDLHLEGANLFGARLYRTDFQKASLRGAELAFSYAAGAIFRGADLRE
jgi:hypothetical protein